MGDDSCIEVRVDHKQKLVTLRFGFVEAGATAEQAFETAKVLLGAVSALTNKSYTIVTKETHA